MTAVDPSTSPAAPSPGGSKAPPTRHYGWALALICIAQLMVVLDATIANIALPYIQSDLNFSSAALPWIITAYSLAFGGFLLLGGRCGDLFGRRKAFMFGLILFAAASLVGGFAENEAMLLGSRAAQGLGAAFASPNALALITTTFEPGPRRSKAFAVYAMMSGVGAAVGLLLGGWLTGLEPNFFGTDISGWRFTFLINVPIGVIAALIAPRLLDESDTHAGQLDVPGALSATIGLLAVVFGVSRAGEHDQITGQAVHGWTDPLTLGAVVGGVALLVAFYFIERRAMQPLLPGRVLDSGSRRAAYLVMMLVPAAMFTLFFFLTLVIQRVMNESPMTTGLMFLPFSVTMIIAATQVSRLVQKVDPGKLAAAGAAIAGLAVLNLSRLPYDTSVGNLSTDISYWQDILPSIVLMPLGMACVFIPMTMSVVHGVRAQDTGIASGVLNTMQQVGGALGLTALSTIAFNVSAKSYSSICADLTAAGQSCTPGDPQVFGVSFVNGATVGFMFSGAMLLVGSFIALRFIKISHQDLASGGPGVQAGAGAGAGH